MEIRLACELGQDIKHGERLVLRLLQRPDPVENSRAPALVPCLYVGANQVLLAVEAVIERGLGDTCLLDDSVYAYDIDSVLVEQFIRCVEQAFTSRQGLWLRRGGARTFCLLHASTVSDRSVRPCGVPSPATVP